MKVFDLFDVKMYFVNHFPDLFDCLEQRNYTLKNIL